MMTVKGATIGGSHTWDDLKMVMTDLVIGAPTVHTSYVEVPGRSGDLDLTEALTGRPVYGNRTITMTLETTETLRGDYWYNTFSDVAAVCHGNKVVIAIDGDEDYYYVGRGQISGHTISGRKQTISLSFNCEPYKYKSSVTTITVDLTTDYSTITIDNDRMPALPEITVDTDCYIVWDETAYAVSAGTWTSLDIEFQDGENELQACTADGTGTITFTWQEGRL